jgi:hypothetical protein
LPDDERVPLPEGVHFDSGFPATKNRREKDATYYPKNSYTPTPPFGHSRSVFSKLLFSDHETGSRMSLFHAFGRIISNRTADTIPEKVLPNREFREK